MINKIFSLIAILTLPGCISLIPDQGTPPEYIHLDPQLKTGQTRHNMQVVVEEPSADLLHNSTKIIILSSDQQNYKFAAGKEWHDRMPAFVQRDLVRAISAKGLLGVGTPINGLKPDYILSGDINKFLVSTQNPDQPRVEIEADFYLMKIPGRQIIARKNFSGSMESAKGFTNIAKSFDLVYSDMLDNIASWVVERKG